MFCEDWVAIVCECQIAKLDVTFYRRLFASIGLVFDRRLGLENGIKAFERCGSALIQIHDVTERDQVPDHPLQVENERGEIARRYLAADSHRDADRDNDHKAKTDKEK